MRTWPALKVAVAVVLVVSMLFGVVAPPAPAQAAQQQPADWDIPNGHFFTQTGKGHPSGFAITDDNGVAFWSEFKRLGGVNGVGYPVSRRFMWNGFVCQAMQNVVFQWWPESQSVSFVNVFDIMHDTGKDAWLMSVRQTPEPKAWNEAGLAWDQVVAGRLAVMDAYPAIKKAYLGVRGDPITMNGLPTTDVVDMGNNYILRAQRVVIQQWKEDVPWAKKGQVTFGLGGAIAAESGAIPTSVAEEVYTNNQLKFRLFRPMTWLPANAADADVAFEDVLMEPDGTQAAFILKKEQSDVALRSEHLVTALNAPGVRESLVGQAPNVQFAPAALVDLGGRKVAKLTFTASGNKIKAKGAIYMFFDGFTSYLAMGIANEAAYAQRHEADFDAVVGSIQPIP